MVEGQPTTTVYLWRQQGSNNNGYHWLIVFGSGRLRWRSVYRKNYRFSRREVDQVFIVRKGIFNTILGFVEIPVRVVVLLTKVLYTIQEIDIYIIYVIL